MDTKNSCLQKNFGVRHIGKNPEELNSALYLQVSIISQALIFVTRSRSWSYVERPGLLLLAAFIAAQLVSIFIFYFEPILSKVTIHVCASSSDHVNAWI